MRSADETDIPLLLRVVATAYERRALGVGVGLAVRVGGHCLPEQTTTVSLLAPPPGPALPFLLAAAPAGRVMDAFSCPRHHAVLVMRGGGLMLVAVGVLQASQIWQALISRVQGLFSG